MFRRKMRQNYRSRIKHTNQLLGLLVHDVFLTPFAKLAELKASFQFLLIFSGKVVDSVTSRTLEFNKIILRHKNSIN